MQMRAGNAWLTSNSRYIYNNAYLLPRKSAEPRSKAALVSVREIWSPIQGRGQLPQNTYKPEDYDIGPTLSDADLSPGPFYVSVFEESTGRIQGLMHLFIYPDTNRYRIFVSQLNTAPWNLENNQATNESNPLYDPKIALRGVGKVMLSAAAQINFRFAQAITGDESAIYGLGCLSADPIFEHLGLMSSTVCGNKALSSINAFALLQRTVDSYGTDLPK